MAKIRPKTLPRVTTPSAGDILILDGANGVRSMQDSDYKTAIAAAIVAAPSTYKIATLDGTNKVPTSQLPASLTGSLVYKGTLAGASVPATSTAAGDYYVIISAGTSQSKTWAVGDLAVYTGVSGSWDQISEGTKQVAQGGTGATTVAAAQTSLDVPSNSMALARAWSTVGHIKFDGLTNGQRATAFVPGLNIGTRDFSFSVVLRVPASDPPALRQFFTIASSSTAQAAFGLRTYINTGGDLTLMLYGATVDVDSRSKVFADFATAYAGQVVRLTITRSGSTVAFYCNKVALSGLADTTAGSAPASMAETVLGQACPHWRGW